jgi:hypothetical protein
MKEEKKKLVSLTSSHGPLSFGTLNERVKSRASMQVDKGMNGRDDYRGRPSFLPPLSSSSEKPTRSFVTH